MDIFGQLGINPTTGIQFFFFAIALLFLSKVVFAPYANALEEREKKTKGGEELALEYHAKAIQLQSEYESKIRHLNNEMKNIIDLSKSDATKHYDSAIKKSRTEAEKLVNENRQKILKEIESVSTELKAQTQTIALTITSKLLGK
jgi:F-type H+-transporting ATPase subunit b